MSRLKDYYEVLGVKEDSSSTEIKKAYRKLAREYHPDHNQDQPHSEERFKEIQEAYEAIGDPKKRKRYDSVRKRPFEGAFGDMFTTNADGQFYRAPDTTFVRGSPQGAQGTPLDDSAFGGLGDLFDSFFGEVSGSQPPESKQKYDRKRTVRVSFKRMLQGGKIEIKLDEGVISIPFPKGVRDGYRVRIKGKGARRPDGRRGDLYVTIRINEHHAFRRDDLNLHTEISVSAIEAMIGVHRSIRGPYGKKLKLLIPSGIQPREILRIRGHGIDSEEKKGDLFVHVSVTIPTDLTDGQRRTLEEAAKVAGLL